MATLRRHHVFFFFVCVRRIKRERAFDRDKIVSGERGKRQCTMPVDVLMRG